MASIRSGIGENMADSDKLIINEAEAIECLKINKPTSGYMMLQESVDMAIQALGKQIPKKVQLRHIHKFDGFDDGECPTCGQSVSRDCDWTDNFCPYCGQKLYWSDEE